MIPNKLKKFLENLDDKDADEMWLYFDGCLVGELVECIINSHLNLGTETDLIDPKTGLMHL